MIAVQREEDSGYIGAMMKFILIAFLATGQVKRAEYPSEEACQRVAAALEEDGAQAFCVIPPIRGAELY